MAETTRPTARARFLRRRRMAWVAVAGLLLQTLIPLSVGQAWAAAPESGIIVICTGNGFKTVTVDGSGQPVPDSKSVEVSCSLCVLHGSVALVSQDVPLAVPVFHVRPVAPPPPAAIPAIQFWRGGSGPSRAPPVGA